VVYFVQLQPGLTNVVAQEGVMKKAILFSLSLFLIVGPALSAKGQTSSGTSENYSAQRQDLPTTGAILGDFIFLRPFCVIATAVGVVGLVASLPISIPSGSVGAVAQKLVAEPFAFTFTRPLGTFPESMQVWP
jgi:hypothetical protein